MCKVYFGTTIVSLPFVCALCYKIGSSLFYFYCYIITCYNRIIVQSICLISCYAIILLEMTHNHNNTQNNHTFYKYFLYTIYLHFSYTLYKSINLYKTIKYILMLTKQNHFIPVYITTKPNITILSHFYINCECFFVSLLINNKMLILLIVFIVCSLINLYRISFSYKYINNCKSHLELVLRNSSKIIESVSIFVLSFNHHCRLINVSQ